MYFSNRILCLFFFLNFLPTDCSDRFNDAALDLSNHVDPEIRKILLDSVKSVQQTKPCIFVADLECIKDNLQKVGLVLLKKAEGLAKNPSLRELFARLYANDENSLGQLMKLPEFDIIGAAIAVCKMFNYKTIQIKKYLPKEN